jgi:hypothetical protein
MLRSPASSLLVLLSLAAVACGSETADDAAGAGSPNASITDERGGDAPSTSPSPTGESPATPGAPAPVVVSVLGVNGLPQADIGVVFHDANGAVIGEAKTATDGKASSTGVPTPAMVSALLGDERAKHVLTWTTVKAGDVLETKNISWGADEIGAYAVTLPGSMPGATFYNGYSGECSGSTNKAESFSIGLVPDCVRAGDSNGVLVIAYGDLWKPIGYAYAKDLTAPVDTKMEVPASAFKALESLDVVIANAPQNTAGDAEVFEVSKGVQVMRGYSPVKGEKATFAVAGSFADSFQVHATASGDDLTNGWFTVSKRVASTTTETSVDFANALPRISETKKDETDATRPVLSWTSAGSLAATDGGHISLRWYDADDKPRGWTLLVAPGASSVKIPALPVTAATFVPGVGVTSTAHVLFVESDAFADHDAFRRTGGRVMPLGTAYGYGSTVRRSVLPSVGMTLRGTEL